MKTCWDRERCTHEGEQEVSFSYLCIMIRVVPYTSGLKHYLEQVRALYESAFPPEERRPWRGMTCLLEEEPRFFLQLLFSHGEFVGFLSYWDLEDCYFGEHFAIIEGARGCGLGRELIASFWCSEVEKNWLFEVEPPEGEIERRRVEFYRSMGAELLLEEYVQPSYETRNRPIPMWLMSYPKIPPKPTSYYVQLIHREVYKV